MFAHRGGQPPVPLLPLGTCGHGSTVRYGRGAGPRLPFRADGADLVLLDPSEGRDGEPSYYVTCPELQKRAHRTLRQALRRLQVLD